MLHRLLTVNIFKLLGKMIPILGFLNYFRYSKVVDVAKALDGKKIEYF